MDNIKQRVEKFKPHLHKRLWNRLIIYFIMSALLLGVTIFNTYKHNVPFLPVVLALFIGIVPGMFLSRMFKISWDADAEHAISRLDVYGAVLLIIYIYIIFEIFRDKIVGIFVPESIIGTVSFALLTGIIYGRFLGMRGTIIKILKDQGKTD